MPTWIPSGEAFGTPQITRSGQAVGIPSGEAFGTPTLSSSSVITVNPTGIPSGEAFGTPTETLVLGPVGIASGEFVSVPLVKTTYTEQLVSGTLAGTGNLYIPLTLLSGILTGSSTLIDPLILIIGLRGFIQGSGVLSQVGFPNPLYGTSTLVGEFFVEQGPPTVCNCKVSRPVTIYKCACGGSISVVTPICSCHGHGHGYRHRHGQGAGAGNATPGVLRWQQFFQPGDLSLFLRDSSGPVQPASVSYTLYIVRNGVPVQAGPANRVPGYGPATGQFYVTGRVGDFGQPGNWLVRWYYQRFFFSEINAVDFPFVVQDAVAAADPRDMTQRVLKYGWD